MLFFISRFFILGGMVIVFMYLFGATGFLLSYGLFGVNIFGNPALLNELNTNPDVLKTLQLSQTLSTIGAFLLPSVYFTRYIGQKPFLFLRVNTPFSMYHVFMAVLLFVVSSPLISWLVYANESITLPASMAAIEQKLRAAESAAAELTKAFTSANTFGGLWLNLFIVALVPAVCEELLFRGALMRFVMYCFKNRHFAVFFSAFLFSAFHGQFFGFIPRFVLGVFLGYVALGSGSIWPSVGAHFINNALATIAAYYQWDVTGPEVFKSDYVFPVYINLLSVAGSAGLIYFFIRAWKNRIFPNGE